MKNVVATITRCAQVGIDKWQNYSVSKVFTQDNTFRDIEIWYAQEIGKRIEDANFEICDVMFSSLTTETVK